MIWLIAKRELVTRGRTRGFLIVTGLMFLAVIGSSLALSLLSGDEEPRSVTIGLTGDGTALADALETGNDEVSPTVDGLGDGTAALERGDVDVVFDGSTLTWAGSPDRTLDDYIREVVRQDAFDRRADRLGIGADDLATLFADVPLDEVRLDGSEDPSEVRFAAAAVAGFANFILIQVWGAFMMSGITEEKSSRVVEVLLSHVRPATLLAGKTLGLGTLAVGQLTIFIAGLVLGLSLVRDLEVPTGVWATVPLLLVTFLLGFGFYATGFAALGSMISRQEDAQTAQLPAMLPLLAGYFIAAFSFETPDNPAVLIGSFVPFTSPVLLPFRTAMIDVPVWQVLLSLLILAVSIVVMIQLAGRIYRYSLLRTGGRVTWTEAWRNRNQESLS